MKLPIVFFFEKMSHLISVDDREVTDKR